MIYEFDFNMDRIFTRQKEAYIKKTFNRGSSRIIWFCFFYYLFVELRHKNHTIKSIQLNHLMAFTISSFNNWFKSFSFLQDMNLLLFLNNKTFKKGKNKNGKLGIATTTKKKPIIIKSINVVLFKKIFFCLQNDLCFIDKKDTPKMILQQNLRPINALNYVERVNMDLEISDIYRKLYMEKKEMSKKQYEKYGIVEL